MGSKRRIGGRYLSSGVVGRSGDTPDPSRPAAAATISLKEVTPVTTRKFAPFVVSTMLASLLALAGCAASTPTAVQPTPAPHPVLGFASPGNDPADAERSPRFETERMLPRPVVLSGSWAR
jgi:hypothetical protein